MSAKLTKEIINNEKLKDRSIKIIGDYYGANKPTDFQCIICNHIWLTRPNNVYNNGTGCPQCAGNIKLTKDIINNERLIGRNLVMIGNFNNCRDVTDFQCKICNYIWPTSTDNIINAGTGCPQCAGTLKLNNDIFDADLVGRNIERLADYINQHTPISFRCTLAICQNIWIAIPKNIRSGRGCPKCGGHIKLTKDFINNERLIGRNITMIGDYVNDATLTDFRCNVENCDHIWSAKPNNIFNGKGCPKCNKPGINEWAIETTLTEINEKFEHNYLFLNFNQNTTKKYKVDYYLAQFNLIIEYNGIQHYEPARFGGISIEQAKINFTIQQKRDQYVDQYCQNNNINIIWIDGRIYKDEKLKDYIREIIIHYKEKAHE